MSAGQTSKSRLRMEARRRTVVTPEGIALSFTIGSRFSRIAALLIDFLIIFASLIIVSLLWIGLAAGMFNSGMKQAGLGIGAEFLLITYILFLFLARYGYFLGFEMGPRGATPGKRLMGLRVAARDGGRLTPQSVIARNLLRDVEFFMPLVFIISASFGDGGPATTAAAVWFFIFMVFAMFNRDAMRAGDLIAGTWVVEAPRTMLAPALSITPPAPSGTQSGTQSDTQPETRSAGQTANHTQYRFSADELAVYGEYELQMLEQILRGGQQEMFEAVAETICIKIGWSPGSGDEHAFLESFYAQLRETLEGGMQLGKRKADKWS